MSAPLDLDATSLQRLQEALADLQHGDVASAASAARRLIKQSPLMEPAHVLLARAQRAQGLNKQAVQTCKAALIALPRSTALWTELALAQRASARLSESERSYSQVLQLQPEWPAAHFELGNVHCAREMALLAVASWRAAVARQSWPSIRSTKVASPMGWRARGRC